MSRPWVIWMILVVCGLLIVGAMGWLTQRTLGMEHERVLAEAEAKVEERVRLALSRMDTAASALLVIENQRPPEHFQSFYEPKVLFTNTLQPVDGGLVSQPSPLLSDPPDFVKLHFEIWANEELTSPQVPVGSRRDLAEASGVTADEIEAASARLETLRGLLKSSVEGQTAKLDANDNRALMISACLPGTTAWNALPMDVVQQRSEEMNEQLMSQVANNYINPKDESSYQQDLTMIDRGKRKQVYEEAQWSAAKSAVKKGVSSSSLGGSMRSAAPSASAAPSKTLLSKPVEQSYAARDDRMLDAEADKDLLAQEKEADATRDEAGSAPRLEMDQKAELESTRQRRADSRSPFGIIDLDVTPFRPLWLDGELFAVRQVKSKTGVRYQGFWIDAVALKDSLLKGVSDLLPSAELTPVDALVGGTIQEGLSRRSVAHQLDPRALVTLPWRLDDGVVVDVALAGVTPLQGSLGLGWVAVLLAMVAAAVLVRSVLRMSERRAAFVSSVTHELRTPLTTFQLYSDLLAEGMVRDEGKRQSYLETMRSEAGRLNHLIENVLSYSRIERGSARARRQQLMLASLIDRFHGRLADRVEREGARIEVVGVEQCGDLSLETDVTAVEQIIFNLVDNACKYGMPDEGERLITLRVSAARRRVKIAVCDGGSGIVRRDRRKLFRPFHKSAHDAAESKPGVGLGLALCRRLAKALGGNLTVDCNRDKGACFVLELPVR